MPPLIEVNAAGPAIAYVGGAPSRQCGGVAALPEPESLLLGYGEVRANSSHQGRADVGVRYRCRCCGLVVQACRFARVTWLRRGDDEKIIAPSGILKVTTARYGWQAFM